MPLTIMRVTLSGGTLTTMTLRKALKVSLIR